MKDFPTEHPVRMFVSVIVSRSIRPKRSPAGAVNLLLRSPPRPHIHQTPRAATHVSTPVYDMIFCRLFRFGSSSQSLALQHFDLALSASWWNGRHFALFSSFCLERHACLQDWSPRCGRPDKGAAITEAWRCMGVRPSRTRHCRATQWR